MPGDKTMPHASRRRPPRQSGFTLIELLVVLLILGLLAGLVGPRVLNHLGGARADTARLQIEEFGAGLDLFNLEVGRYPTTEEGLLALSVAPSGVDNWNGPYLKQYIPSDPWGNDYHYRAPGRNGDYDLYSLGADNADGGNNEDADIVSW
jgi:general secretion pathway protein G